MVSEFKKTNRTNAIVIALVETKKVKELKEVKGFKKRNPLQMTIGKIPHFLYGKMLPFGNVRPESVK